jgi:hypothetical protein
MVIFELVYIDRDPSLYGYFNIHWGHYQPQVGVLPIIILGYHADNREAPAGPTGCTTSHQTGISINDWVNPLACRFYPFKIIMFDTIYEKSILNQNTSCNRGNGTFLICPGLHAVFLFSCRCSWIVPKPSTTSEHHSLTTTRFSRMRIHFVLTPEYAWMPQFWPLSPSGGASNFWIANRRSYRVQTYSTEVTIEVSTLQGGGQIYQQRSTIMLVADSTTDLLKI